MMWKLPLYGNKEKETMLNSDLDIKTSLHIYVYGSSLNKHARHCILYAKLCWIKRNLLKSIATLRKRSQQCIRSCAFSIQSQSTMNSRAKTVSFGKETCSTFMKIVFAHRDFASWAHIFRNVITFRGVHRGRIRLIIRDRDCLVNYSADE